jgi:hypothetical protein
MRPEKKKCCSKHTLEGPVTLSTKYAKAGDPFDQKVGKTKNDYAFKKIACCQSVLRKGLSEVLASRIDGSKLLQDASACKVVLVMLTIET